MKKTIISHFYNEEYLLPLWLNHHKQFFDDGLMIDYNSTDRSCEIIKEICPNWKIVKTKNEWFSAVDIDREVMEYEANIEGWRIVLNTTEFIIGDFKMLDGFTGDWQILVPGFSVLDLDGVNFDYNVPIFNNDIKYMVANENVRRSRSLHNVNYIQYPTGRHYSASTTIDFTIFHFKYFPMNKQMIDRMLQIQHKCSPSDIQASMGVEHHNWGAGLKEEDVWKALNNYRDNYVIVDPTPIIDRLKAKSNIS